jgi:outer membrane protein TolC
MAGTTRRKSSRFLVRFGVFLLSYLIWANATARADDAKQSGPLSLADCIDLGLDNQPAMAAAQASLDAAEANYEGVSKLRLFRFLSPDIPIRKKQAHLGVAIASAALGSAEWETRYAITRNFFSVIYAREQLEVVKSVVAKLQRARNKAAGLLKSGDPTIKVTKIDVDNLDINIAFYEAKQQEAEIGIKRAEAALREAMGVGRDFDLNLARASLPQPVKDLQLSELIDVALERRGEMAQASSVYQVTELEIAAQKRTIGPSAKTFAAAGDVHATPIPQGISNTEYRPGAIGIEMPTLLGGKKADRIQRARAFNARAAAVVDKTRNLITLEVEANYYKWQEALLKLQKLQKTLKLARDVGRSVEERLQSGNVTGEELIRAQTLEEQSRAQYNDALYMHALGLAGLERVTAGGYRPSYAPTGATK